MTASRTIAFLCMLGGAAAYAQELTGVQHLEKGLALLKENDGSIDGNIPTDAGLTLAIGELEAALAKGITPNKDARLALGKAYYICMSIADSTKESPATQAEKHAAECRQKGAVLMRSLDAEFPADVAVLEQYGKSAIFDKELQLAIYERLVRVSPDNAEAHVELGSLYLLKGKNKGAASQFREAIRLQPDPQRVAYSLKNLRAALEGMGCKLSGLETFSNSFGAMYLPYPGDDNKTKEKFAAEFSQLKKQLVVTIDGHRCGG